MFTSSRVQEHFCSETEWYVTFSFGIYRLTGAHRTMQAYLYNVVSLPTERGELVSDSVTFWKIVTQLTGVLTYLTDRKKSCCLWTIDQ